jgi:hypothetical protein
MSYDNELKGVLFKNKEKRPDKKDADYRGNATVGGVEYWLDAWINEPKGGGEKYMSLKLKAKQGDSKPKVEPPPFDDSVPF